MAEILSRRSIAILLLLALAVPSVGGAHAVRYLFDAWREFTVVALVQDSVGYLWIGTSEGLYRFDGVRFVRFDQSNTPELGSNVVVALVADPDGGLWVGTLDGILRFRDGSWSVLVSRDELSERKVQSLCRDRSGSLWVGTGEGLRRYDSESSTTYKTWDGLPGGRVQALLEDRRGRIWIGHQHGLSSFEQGRLTSYAGRDGPFQETIRTLYQDRRDRLWIGSEAGLYRLEEGAVVPASSDTVLARTSVFGIAEDSGGSLWIGTVDGLFRLSGETPRRFGVEDGLPELALTRVVADREGNLWIGTVSRGVVRLRESPVRNFGVADGLPHAIALAVLQSRDGAIWVGTSDGLARLGPGGAVRTFTSGDGLPGPQVRALYEDRQGSLWIATNGGVAQLAGGELRADPRTRGLERPTCFAEDRTGSFWIGTEDGLARLDEDLRVFTARDGLPSVSILDLHTDARGVLWVATESGLVRREDDAFTVVPDTAGQMVLDIYGDHDASLWLGLVNVGLGRLRGGELDVFTTADGLATQDVIGVVEDDGGRLWLASPTEIFRLDKSGFDLHPRAALGVVGYDRSDGLETGKSHGFGQPPIWKADDGKVWVATLKGVVSIDTTHLGDRSEPPSVVLEEVLVDGERVDPRRPAVFRAGTKNFELRYTALSLTDSERIRFRYRLEGFDEDWVDVGTRRAAYYTSLPPGSYRFFLAARDNRGNRSGEKVLFEMRLRPAFYRTWSFYSACAGLLAVLAWGAHRYRVAGLKHLNQKLQEAQLQLEAQNAVLEKSSRELEYRNREMESFVYTVSHDLKAPLFTIQGYLGLVRRDLEENDAEQLTEDLAQIHDAGSRMSRLLEALLELSRIGRMINPSEELSLTQLARQAFRNVAEHRGGPEVELLISPDLPTIHGDGPRLLGVLENLIDNAVKFMGDESAPRIEVGSFAGEDPKGARVVFVRDNGMGIDPRYQEKIFELFDQLDPRMEGNGLGLALVRRVVELYGGRVWVESEGLGHGSTFYFTLPEPAG